MDPKPSSTEVNCCANPPTEEPPELCSGGSPFRASLTKVSALPPPTWTVLPLSAAQQNLMCFANEGSSISYPAEALFSSEA